MVAYHPVRSAGARDREQRCTTAIRYRPGADARGGQGPRSRRRIAQDQQHRRPGVPDRRLWHAATIFPGCGRTRWYVRSSPRDRCPRISLAPATSQFALPSTNLTPLGTMAHEYLQACQAVGPRLRDSQTFRVQPCGRANIAATLASALSDVCGMDAFLRDLRSLFLQAVRRRAPRFRATPSNGAKSSSTHYHKMRIDPRTKTMVFSDSLNIPLAMRLVRILPGPGQAHGVWHRYESHQRSSDIDAHCRS